jgi:hypothetical protein
MHPTATILLCGLLTTLAAGSALAQGSSGFEYPAPLNTNAAVDSKEDRNPRVASDGLGNWVAVWQSKNSLGGRIDNDSDILVSRSSDGAASWTDPTPLNTNAAADREGDFLPQIATDGLPARRIPAPPGRTPPRSTPTRAATRGRTATPSS